MKIFSKDQQVISFMLGLMIFTIALFRPYHPFHLNLKILNTDQPHQQSIIEVIGAVKNPGIYTFDEYPTAFVAIQNTFDNSIDEHCFSFDSKYDILDSGTRIELYGWDAECPLLIITPMSYRKKLILGIPVKLNHANIYELDMIPGISHRLAKRIVEFRKSHGPFKTWNDLKRVQGIGPKKIETLQFYSNLK